MPSSFLHSCNIWYKSSRGEDFKEIKSFSMKNCRHLDTIKWNCKENHHTVDLCIAARNLCLSIWKYFVTCSVCLNQWSHRHKAQQLFYWEQFGITGPNQFLPLPVVSHIWALSRTAICWSLLMTQFVSACCASPFCSAALKSQCVISCCR